MKPAVPDGLPCGLLIPVVALHDVFPPDENLSRFVGTGPGNPYLHSPEGLSHGPDPGGMGRIDAYYRRGFREPVAFQDHQAQLEEIFGEGLIQLCTSRNEKAKTGAEAGTNAGKNGLGKDSSRLFRSVPGMVQES